MKRENRQMAGAIGDVEDLVDTLDVHTGSFRSRHGQQDGGGSDNSDQADDAQFGGFREGAGEDVFDAAAEGALGFDDTDQAQAQGGAAMKGKFGDVEQRLGVVGSGFAHGDQDRFVDRLFADAADHRVGEPEKRIIEVDDLQ